MKLSKATINPQIIAAKYAVRGALAQRAEQIRDELSSDPKSHPFPDVTSLNIGNPQQLDQQPLTFVRQVLSLVQYPALLDSPPSIYQADALERARSLLKNIGSVGAYSHSKGVPFIRESVARFISNRDGYAANPEEIFLSAGASSAAEKIMNLVAHSDEAGILVPVPQYPLYSATSSLLGTNFVGYSLDEANAWSTSTENIAARVKEAQQDGIVPRVIVVINPGNPTGSVLEEHQIADIIKLARDKNLIILADEVYQENIFHDTSPPFVSFKKVRSQLAERDASYAAVPLASLHSTSKGYIGECGQRGGYMECVGFPADVLDELYKLASIELCPSVSGQVLTEIMVNPPKAGDASYETFASERRAILERLHTRAMQLYEAFNRMDGVECQRPMGAMYLFPKITVPLRAVAAAEKEQMAPDTFYAMALLNATGICVVPGSGFGQEPNTFHFRTTFLAPGGDALSQRFIDFHNSFMKEWS